jgi:hypothetical protein
MRCASTSTALEHRPKIRPWPSFRSQLAAGGAVAGAGVLVVGLVIAPPKSDGPSPEVHAVRVANVALSHAASSVVLLDDWVRSQARNVAPFAPVVPGPADITSAVATVRSAIAVNPAAFDPAAGLATIGKSIGKTIGTAVLTAAGAILPPLLANPITGPIIGPILVLGGIGVLVVAVAIIGVVAQVQEAISGLVGSLPSLPFLRTTAATTSEVEATVTPTLKTDPQVSDPTPGPSVESIDPPAPTKRLRSTTVEATKDLTETVEADDIASGPTTVSALEPSTDVPTAEPAKPAPRHATPRSVVRDVLGLGRQVRDLLHRPPTGDGAAKGRTSPAASSPATSPSTRNNSKDGDSPAGGSSADGPPAGDSANP